MPDSGTLKWHESNLRLNIHVRSTIAVPQIISDRAEAHCGHVNGVMGLAFSSDSKTLISLGRDELFKKWGVEPQSLIASVDMQSGWSQSAVSSHPDGFMFENDGSIYLLGDDGVQVIFQKQEGGHYWLSGGTVGFERGQQLELTDVRSDATTNGTLPPNPVVHEGVEPLLVSLPAGAIAFLGHEQLQVYDLATGRLRWAHALSEPHTACWSADGSLIAVSTDRSPPMVLSQTGKVLAELQTDLDRDEAQRTGEQGGVLAFSDDGSALAMGTDSGRVRIWNPRTGALIREFFSPGVSVCSAWDPRVGVYPAAHDFWVLSLAFSPDGQTLASGGYNHLIRLWDVATGKPKGVLGSHANKVLRVKATADSGFAIAAYEDGYFRRINIEAGTIDAETALPEPVAEDSCVDITTELALSGTPSGHLRFYCTESLELTREFQHDSPVAAIAVLPDGKRFALMELSPSDSLFWRLTIRSVDDATICTTFEGWPADMPRVGYGQLAVSPDGQTIAAAVGDALSLWNTGTGELFHYEDLTDHRTCCAMIASIWFSSDGILALGMDAEVRLIDAKTGKLLRGIGSYGDCVTCVAFSPDQKRIAIGTAYETSTRISDLESGEAVGYCNSHRNSASQADYTPCGTRLITAGYDGLIKIWNTESDDLIHTVAPASMILD